MNKMTEVTEEFHIFGDVGSLVFPVWITRHSDRLGLRGNVAFQSADRLDLLLAGPDVLLDAMALACSLGPCDVLVDRIERFTVGPATG